MGQRRVKMQRKTTSVSITKQYCERFKVEKPTIKMIREAAGLPKLKEEDIVEVKEMKQVFHIKIDVGMKYYYVYNYESGKYDSVESYKEMIENKGA